MKPATKSAGEALAALEPSKTGKEREKDGGATAPAQNIEQALHDECVDFSTLAWEPSSPKAASASVMAWSP